MLSAGNACSRLHDGERTLRRCMPLQQLRPCFSQMNIPCPSLLHHICTGHWKNTWITIHVLN